ncbi:hypothetical protein HJG60_010607 [Phyllostomus discolor]|uniref:Uncharacterized protein n=1 Tax=Phyllostomus discolor TaxID=89673 RepID=A0A834EHM4_9CHIR|nr:hypothetical protein HJG60_010607 [Phyllostomus discolor]
MRGQTELENLLYRTLSDQLAPFSSLSICWRGRSHPEWGLCGVLVQTQSKCQVRMRCQSLQYPQAQHDRIPGWEGWLALGLPPSCSPCAVESREESWPDPASRGMPNSTPAPDLQIPSFHALSQHTHRSPPNQIWVILVLVRPHAALHTWSLPILDGVNGHIWS